MSPLCLIVDESLMVRRVGARIIRELGYEVIEAKTGVSALDTARLRRPDVILTEWQVGEMDAPTLIKTLTKELGADRTRFILCTADRRVERIVEALAAGADEYIMKPFDSDIIESKFVLAGLPVRLPPSGDAAAPAGPLSLSA